MTASGAIRSLRPGAAPVGVGLLALAALLVAWILVPADALARGWLLVFAVGSGLPVGSLVLLMIHRLTGGRWGDALGPVLRPASTGMPVVALAFVPVAIALSAIYPWAADPSTAPASVVRLYLDPPWFLLRAGIALLGWSVLGVVFGRGHGGRLLAGLGLAFYGLSISLVAVDWYLSLEPHFVSTAFASMIAIEQILTALAVAAVISPTTLTGEATADVGGLLIATILGVVYLELMTFIVSWYGDLPDKAEWYLKRGDAIGATAIAVATLLATLAFALLLSRAARRSRTGLRIAGLLAVAAVTVHLAWLILPAFETGAGAALTAACVYTAGLLVAFAALRRGHGSTAARRPAHAS